MILRFLLGCTAHMNHIEAHMESFHRIVPVDLAVFAFTFFALGRSLQSSVCKRRVEFSNCRYGRSWGRGVLFPSQAEVPRIARECRLRLLRSLRQ